MFKRLNVTRPWWQLQHGGFFTAVRPLNLRSTGNRVFFFYFFPPFRMQLAVIGSDSGCSRNIRGMLMAAFGCGEQLDPFCGLLIIEHLLMALMFQQQGRLLLVTRLSTAGPARAAALTCFWSVRMAEFSLLLLVVKCTVVANHAGAKVVTLCDATLEIALAQMFFAILGLHSSTRRDEVSPKFC